MDSSHFLIQMKNFVKSSDCLSTRTVPKDEQKQPTRPAFISGTHVKQFYEETLGKEALITASKTKLKEDKTIDKSKSKTTFKTPVDVNVLMKAVEAGSIKDVEAMLETDKDCLHCRDQFGWSPLMSACCAGDLPMVQLLLRWRPDLGVSDKRGNTCHTLAAARGHQSIVDILDQHTHRPAHKRQPTVSDQSSDSSTFFCKVCKQNVENTTFKKHLSSTVHNFHAASKRKMPTLYGIPESNKGFQILVKSGWNKEDGLGPSGEGHKFPPKTVLKQDRTGLGAKRYKARVTHTLEDSRREQTSVNMFKSHFKSKKKEDQRLEIRIRRMLS